MLKFIILSILFLFSRTVFANESFVTDNISFFQNIENLNNISKNFHENNKINIYYYTVENATQEDFDNILQQYNDNNTEDFILFFIVKETGNIAIYNNKNLDYIITDVNKMIILKSMEGFFNEGNYEGAFICAVENLDEIIKNSKSNEIVFENELDINFEAMEKQRKISIIVMGVSALIFCLGFVFLFKKPKKQSNLELKDNSNNISN